MKVLIEARALSAKGGGVKTYVRELINHMIPMLSGIETTIVLDRPGARVEIGAGHEEVLPLWHEVLLPWWLSKGIGSRIRVLEPDVVHYTKAAVPRNAGAPSVVTIYDVIPILYPSSQTWLRRVYWPAALRQAAHRSDHILTISEASRRDIVKYLGVPAEKITVTPLAADTARYRPDIGPEEKIQVKAKLRLKGPYILCLTTRDERKNVGSLIRAFAKVAPYISHDLVIAGKPALKHDASTVIAARLAPAVRDRVRFLDFVDYNDLPALYAGADLFVWPSVYEGWGFPPQEAMASGVPVIVSDGGSLPEVVGEAGEIVKFTTDDLAGRTHDDDFIAALAKNIGVVLHDAPKRARMRAAGLAQAKKFTWDDVARKTLEVYKKVASLNL
ncbi:MAG: glycosyltransferase family 4 protein [Candidatus Andersenbacteria bacterium]|nr:glycosyltransferase family 4 protein [Candidatus Andersenbacteria bacterium]